MSSITLAVLLAVIVVALAMLLVTIVVALTMLLVTVVVATLPMLLVALNTMVTIVTIMTNAMIIMMVSAIVMARHIATMRLWTAQVTIIAMMVAVAKIRTAMMIEVLRAMDVMTVVIVVVIVVVTTTVEAYRMMMTTVDAVVGMINCRQAKVEVRMVGVNLIDAEQPVTTRGVDGTIEILQGHESLKL